MKFTFLALVLSFISTATLACPEIGGTYVCTFNGHEQVVNYATRSENGVSIYKMDLKGANGEIPADGVMRKYGSNPDIQLALTCADSNLFLTSLMTNVSGDVANFACAGSGVVKIDGNSVWTVSGNTIDQDNKGLLYCGNGNVLNMKGQSHCVKQ